jgi:hypothetical protein
MSLYFPSPTFIESCRRCSNEILLQAHSIASFTNDERDEIKKEIIRRVELGIIAPPLPDDVAILLLNEVTS